MTKLGPHIIQNTSAALTWARTAPIVKALDRIDVLAAAPDSAIRIFRHFFPTQDMANVDGAYHEILDALKGYRHPNLYVETYNEVPKGELQRYLTFLTLIVPKFHDAGIMVAGPSWASGDFEQADWTWFQNAGWCWLDLISLHAYWGTQGFTPWHALRYRTYHQSGDPQLIITECGRDAVEGGKGGWQRDGLSKWMYADELIAYDAELAKDSYVLGATPFTSGPSPDWAAFSMDPISPLLPTGGQPLPLTYTSGFDISNNNGNVDWSITGLLDGYGFVSIKATEGKDFKDKYFAANWDNAAKAGLVRQAYHFGRPSEGSGHDEAKAFLSVVQAKLEKGDSVCLDLEDTNVGATADLHAYAIDFLKTCEDALGFKPMFYSGRWYTGPHNLEGHADLAQYGLWIASWAPTRPDITGMGWPFWAAWQFGAGPIPGITGVCDLDVFNGPIDQLRKYGKP